MRIKAEFAGNVRSVYKPLQLKAIVATENKMMPASDLTEVGIHLTGQAEHFTKHSKNCVVLS
jgi:hypothetical protein